MPVFITTSADLPDGPPGWGRTPSAALPAGTEYASPPPALTASEDARTSGRRRPVGAVWRASGRGAAGRPGRSW